MYIIVLERIRSLRIVKWVRSTISAWPSYQSVPDGTINFQVKLKTRAALGLVSSLLRTRKHQWIKLISSKRILSRLGRDLEMLLIANGPSSSKLIPEVIRDFQSNGGLVGVMNGYLYSDLSKEIVPDLYFMMDPAMWNKVETPTFADDISLYLLTYPQIHLVQPVSLPEISSRHSRYLYVTHLNSSGLVKMKNPFLCWGLASSTALVAVGCLRKMRLRKVYFAGFDGDSYLHFRVSDNLNLFFENSHHHFYSSNSDNENANDFMHTFYIPPDLIKSIADVLYAEAILRRDFNLLTKGKFVNVSGGSVNDLGPRDDLFTLGFTK